MVTYRGLWDKIISSLQTNAAVLGVEADSIRGGWMQLKGGNVVLTGNKPAPSITVMITPGPTQSLMNRRMVRTAQVSIVCLASGKGSIEPVVEANELAEEVEEVMLAELGDWIGDPDIVPLSYNSPGAVFAYEFDIQYKSHKDLT